MILLSWSSDANRMAAGQRGGSTEESAPLRCNFMTLFGFAAFLGLTPTPSAFSQESSRATKDATETAVSNSQSGGRRFDPGAVHQSPQRLTATFAVAVSTSGAASGQHQEESGCSAEVPFEPSPEPLARYAGAVWMFWPGGEAAAAILSEDDGARHARGYRNRWRYWLTGATVIGLPSGCRLRLVTVRALVGGLVALEVDQLRLLILPGDPNTQDRISKSAPACEANRQLVTVDEVSGRWRITIEEPTWLPWTRERC